MSMTIVGIFERYDQAENAAREVKERGLRTDDISIVAKHGDEAGEADSIQMGTGSNEINDNISGGVMSGGVLGGIAGLLIGAGSMAIPGLGIIAAAGPITGLLGGAVTGGIVGGLVDLGIPEKKGEDYEEDVRAGRVLFSMKADEDKIDKIATILRNSGAYSVDKY